MHSEDIKSLLTFYKILWGMDSSSAMCLSQLKSDCFYKGDWSWSHVPCCPCSFYSSKKQILCWEALSDELGCFWSLHCLCTSHSNKFILSGNFSYGDGEADRNCHVLFGEVKKSNTFLPEVCLICKPFYWYLFKRTHSLLLTIQPEIQRVFFPKHALVNWLPQSPCAL